MDLTIALEIGIQVNALLANIAGVKNNNETHNMTLGVC